MFKEKDAKKTMPVGTLEETALFPLVRGLLQTQDPEEQIRFTLDYLQALPLPYLHDTMSIFLFDKFKQDLVLAGHRGNPSRVVQCLERLRPGECLCGRAAQERTIVYSALAHKDPFHVDRNNGLLPHADLCVPLLSPKDHLVGVWHAALSPGSDLNDESWNFLAELGKIIGSALFHALKYQAMKEWNQDLQENSEEQKRNVEDLTVALTHAREAKSDFLVSMNHELRTPLNPIIGFSQVLLGEYFGELNEKQKQHVMDILESGKRLLDLIDEILDLSRVELGHLEMDLATITIGDLIPSMLKMNQEKAIKHGIAVSLDLPEDVEGIQILADEKKIKTVLYNLLSNAVKFTPDGGTITVGARLAQRPDPGDRHAGELEDEKAQWIEIYVQDDGAGVEPEEQEKIFQDFYQVTRGFSGKPPGTGLGLSITRRFVNMHGGRVLVESKGSNQGSRFVVLLPVSPDSSMESSG